ncbi:Cl-channel protein [Sanghuangporus baumii]|uniref:Chloride channel protein n=1 Tax=Sanghuangporus baumii TaxID=108892 RepID=A0A9Q5HUS1_SANBA|nr:Cl-channel protein [Sanghuangporus baumii]
MATTVNPGIQTLFDAEKDAKRVVEEARKYRAQRLKDARTEADKEIEEYKAMKEEEFKAFEASRQGTTQNSQSAIDKETDEKLEEITKSYEKNKDAVVKKLIDRVTVVKAEIHRNLKKVERSHDSFESWDDPWTREPLVAPAEEVYELHDNHELLSTPKARLDTKVTYRDGSTIDWLREEAAERSRRHRLRSFRGLRGLLLPLLESSRIWLVVVGTGVGVGITGAWLDVLVHWFSDLREGRCAYGFFYNQVACCSGIDPGEVCTDWLSWSQWFGVHTIFVSSLLQAIIYISLAIAFSSSAAFLVLTYAPYAFHTGIPEIKAILGGYVFDEFLGPWTLLIKSLGLVLSVASGLSVGKEGPLVHVSCCMAFLLSKMFKKHIRNEALKRRILAAAAAAGISVAFGSPLGGVLFGLEELDVFANDSDVLWKGFVTSAVAAMTLQYVDPFGTSKLVLFAVSSGSDTWRAFELVPWLCLAVMGGVLGALLIRLNVAAAVFRHNSYLRGNPILEVVGATAFTAGVSYLIVFLRVQSSELVANLFQDCDISKGDYHGLCNPNALVENIFLLILTAAIKIGLTAWSFGMMVPAGIFLPTIAIGACLGRAMGLIVQGIHRTYPDLWIFSTCPPDPLVPCINPGFYAVIGASAMLGGVTRMTISLVVILFELTGALSHVLPIMISVMVSKWVADAFGKEGIYSRWIALHKYPWLPYAEYRDKGETAANVMIPLESLVTVDAYGCSLRELARLVTDYNYHGFPVTASDRELIGYVTKAKLKAAIDPLFSDESMSETVVFMKNAVNSSTIDLSGLVDEAVIQLRKEIPQELVVRMFQKMNMRYIFFTRFGKLDGIVTKTDIVTVMSSHVPYVGALASDQQHSENAPKVVFEAR